MDQPLSPFLSSYPSLRAPERLHVLPAAIIEHGSDELKNLVYLKSKGWNDQEMDYYFAEQRSAADNAGPTLNLTWFHRMKTVLQEVDLQAQCIPTAGKLNFLDLGCCPGGFSSYILAKNAEAKGFGISLETANGGHEYLLERRFKSRHDLHLTNLTLYQLGPSKITQKGLKVVPFDIRNRMFDLALLDGHQLRTQTFAMPWDGSRLAISQIILALEAVKVGGTVIVKLSRPEHHYTARILYLLDNLSERLFTCKPRSIHALRGTFYAVAKGIGCGADAENMSAILESFKKLWVELTFGGDGSGRFLTEVDIDFIINVEDLIKTYLDRLVELGRDVWVVQTGALTGMLKKKGVI